MPTKDAQEVALVLLNLEAEAVGRDEDGNMLEVLMNDLSIATTCCTALYYLSKSNPSHKDDCVNDKLSWNEIQQPIRKFVKVNDRYLALASVLLKSRAFHETHPTTSNSDCCCHQYRRPIVQLPRTVHSKPFIPETSSRLSISHQYPFAGMVRLIQKPQKGAKGELEAGFDIVVFEAINPRLYNSIQEFVDVFCNMFAPSEWSALNDTTTWFSDGDSQLREFYLRWAIKEAYTKALGVGLGFDFSSFETTLDSLEKGMSLWEWLTATVASPPEQEMARTMGTVTQVASTTEKTDDPMRPQQERWLFVFRPLYKVLDASVDQDSSWHRKMTGCACACIGPIDHENDAADLNVCVEWTSTKALIDWHCNS